MEDQRADRIEQDISDIRTNHLTHIEADIKDINAGMVDVKIEQVVQGNDLKWLKKFFFIVATASIGSLLAGLLGLILR